MSVAAPLVLREGDRSRLEALTRSSSIRAGLAQRARIVLLAADGVPTPRSRERVGMSRPTVIDWRERYAAGGIDGLDDQPRAGRPPEIDEVDVVVATLPTPPPAQLGVTHWSSRLLADAAGDRRSPRWPGSGASGAAAVAGETFKFSTDPELDAKVRDVVGLYLDPPEKAVVLCVDEKSQIQALDRTAPILPMRPGLPEKAHPRLRPARHHHPVRRAGGRHRQGHRRLLPAAPPPGVPALPQAGRQGLPAGAAAPGRATTTPPTSTPTVKAWLARNPRITCTSPRPPAPG